MRQTGKTTALKALAREINEKGDMVALYFTLETVQQFTDMREGIPKIVETMRNAVLRHPLFRELVRDPSSEIPALLPPPPGLDVKAFLALLAEKSGKQPLVVFFDEADCLVGDVLISFLRQLRDGYVNRKEIPFPASVALVGMLDVRDYKAQIRPDGESLGQISPFNIISKDMLIRNFTEDEVRALYAQHTAETGQVFEENAIDAVMRFTCGQPWLVNALARECAEEIHGFRYEEPITAADVEVAKETIIRRRDTHVDSLMERSRRARNGAGVWAS